MNTIWFKTTSGTFINKICSYILSGQGEPTVLNHLYESELKSNFPVFRIENPTTQLYQEFPYLKNRSNLDLWDLSWHCLNIQSLLWLLEQKFPVSQGKLNDLIHQLKNPNATLTNLQAKGDFKKLLIKLIDYYKVQNKDFVTSAQDRQKISLEYELISACSKPIANELIKELPPKNFLDLRFLKQEQLNLALSLYSAQFPLIHNIMTYENKKFIWPTVDQSRNTYVEEINQLVTDPKLLDGLTNVFGFSSKNFVKNFEPTFFKRSSSDFTLDLPYLKKVNFLKNVFLPNNHNDFLHFLNANLSKIENAYLSIEQRNNLEKLLNLFNDEQKHTLLSNLVRQNIEELPDALETFGNSETYFKKFFKENDFKKFDRFSKIIATIFEEEEMAACPLQEMDQTEFFPEAKQLLDLTFPDDYKIIIPTNNHQLIQWGVEMGHCVGGEDYQEDTANGDCLIVGLALGDKVKYAVEVRDNELVQVLGKSKCEPKPLVYSSLIKALEVLRLIER